MRFESTLRRLAFTAAWLTTLLGAGPLTSGLSTAHAQEGDGPQGQPAGPVSREPLPMPGPGQSLSDMPPPPWANTTDVPNPAFLDTTDRRIDDDRPPPSPEQIQALQEMEAEVRRFMQSGSAYRGSVNSILVREYHRRRRERQAGYARQIREEERLQNEAMERAIRLFEAFIRRYPDDPNYTPDAMFRLGELYYERAAIAYQEAAAAGEAMGVPDFSETVELYRALIQRFPDYRRIDGVYYLIGYCLNEMARNEEARLAWLNLVCANRFDYTGEPPAPEPPPGGEEGFSEEEHPALGLGGTLGNETMPFDDPYAGCTPVTPDARFVMEVWLRIGEYHFDFDFEPHALDRAISAYGKVLADPTDRNYNLALYKVAWAYYRASRYPEAIEHFSRLIEWSDEQLRQTGRAGMSSAAVPNEVGVECVVMRGPFVVPCRPAALCAARRSASSSGPFRLDTGLRSEAQTEARRQSALHRAGQGSAKSDRPSVRRAARKNRASDRAPECRQSCPRRALGCGLESADDRDWS